MKKQTLYVINLIFLLVSTYVNAEGLSPKKTVTATASQTTHQSKLRQVAAHEICMVNDVLFKGEQIKVTLDEKDYYGCCAMCKNHLNRDPTIRKAYDPLSGVQVDKATAIIGVDTRGNAYYFENQNNLKQYQLPIPKKTTPTL